MSKTEADSLKKINTKFLKDRKYFTGHKGGVINWTNKWSDIKSSVGIQVSTLENYLRIYYTQTDNDSGEKKQFDYKVPLTSTSCNYGGKRYWFSCPMFKGGIYCGKRVNTLYKDGDYFACRHCYNLTYSSRNLSGFSKKLGNVCLVDVEKTRDQVKTMYYKGKATKKYLSYLKKERKFENAFINMAYMLNNKTEKIKL